MQRYNEFRVISMSPELGQVELAWFDNTRNGQGTLVTPLEQQNVLFRSHAFPIEAEENNWTRQQCLDWWLNEIDDVPDIPQWAQDEIGDYTLETGTRLRPSSNRRS